MADTGRTDKTPASTGTKKRKKPRTMGDVLAAIEAQEAAKAGAAAVQKKQTEAAPVMSALKQPIPLRKAWPWAAGVVVIASIAYFAVPAYQRHSDEAEAAKKILPLLKDADALKAQGSTAEAERKYEQIVRAGAANFQSQEMIDAVEHARECVKAYTPPKSPAPDRSAQPANYNK